MPPLIPVTQRDADRVSEELGLLDAIAEQPDADLDRHIYSDFLEDRGESARAEFVRLQLALARLPEEHPDRAALTTRERGLLLHHENAWTLGLRDLADAWTFRRGFVEEVVIRQPLSPAQFDELFRWPLVRRIRTNQGWRLFPGLIESEGTRRLESLHVEDTQLDGRHFRDLFDCERLDRLRSLTLNNCGFDNAAMRRLVKSPLLDRLTTLEVCGPIGTDGGERLARSARVERLRRLKMSGCGLTDDTALALASAPLLGKLTALDLSHNSLGEVGAQAILRCPHFRELTDLDLSHISTYPAVSFWSDLFSPGGLVRLQRLALRENRLSIDQLAHFLASERLAELNTLDLSDCILLDRASFDTVSSDFPSTPLHLILNVVSYDNPTPLDDLLSAAIAFRRVARLDLRTLRESEFAALLASPHLARLRWLSLSDSHSLDDLVGTLGSSNLSRQLTALDLSRCGLTDGDAIDLATKFPHLANLTRLSLRTNHIGSRGARALACSPYLRNLRHLDLSGNDIDDEGAFHLASAEHLASPVVLDVSNNDIGPEGMGALLGAAERAFARGVTIPTFDT